MQISLSQEFKKIISLFLVWRVVLIFIAIIAVFCFPLGSEGKYLGGGFQNYLLLPSFYSWGNFDGEHYAAISLFGYQPLNHAFFPLYPKIISVLTLPFKDDFLLRQFFSIFFGITISSLFFIVALMFLKEIIKLDYKDEIAWKTILLLILFPTSFYFVSMYNESVFLFLVISAFLFARKKKWFIAALLAFFACLTRVFGIPLFGALLIEAWQQRESLKKYYYLFFIPIGLIIYMSYLYFSVGDALAFYHLQLVVGEQHQSGIITLPQVFIRYIKMLTTVNLSNPIYQTLVLEVFSGLIFLILPIIGFFKKIRLSYLFYSFFGFIIPTIQGSFSSLPRYILVLFPSFIVIALIISKMPKSLRVVCFVLLGLIQIIEVTLFLRGYWVA